MISSAAVGHSSRIPTNWNKTRARIDRWCSGRGRSCWRHPPYRRSAAPGGRAGGRYLAKKVCPQVCQVGGERGQNQVIRVVRSHSRSSKESQSQEKKLAEITHALPLHDQKTVGTRADLIDHGRLQVDLRNSGHNKIAYVPAPAKKQSQAEDG